MLTVKKSARRTRVTERSFEKAFAKALKACGFNSWHMNSREAGWPDRYVQGGIWIEFKVLDRWGTDNGTEAEQRAKMAELDRSGDLVFYCARCGDQVIFQPWINISNGPNLAGIEKYAYRTKEDLMQIVLQKIA